MTDEEFNILGVLAYRFDTGLIEREGRFVRTTNVTSGRAGQEIFNKDRDGYLRMNIGKKKYFQHRLVYLWVTKSLPKGQIDHINNVSADNRFENLRDVTAGVNQKNLPMRRGGNTTGFMGVKPYHKGGFTAHFRVKRVRREKKFRNLSDAVIWVNTERDKAGFSPGHGSDRVD